MRTTERVHALVRASRRLALALMVATPLLLSVACSADAPSRTTAPNGVTSATDLNRQDGTLDVNAFRKRCLSRTPTLTRASLYFDSDVDLVVGESRTYRVAIDNSEKETYTDLPRHSKIQLVCTVQAQLVAGATVTVAPTGWDNQKYLPPEPSTWEWVVTAKSPGTAKVILKLKPVLENGHGEDPTELRTTSYDITFHASSLAQSSAAKVGGIFSGFWGVLVSICGGVSVIGGAVVAGRGLLKRARGAEAGDKPSTVGE